MTVPLSNVDSLRTTTLQNTLLLTEYSCTEQYCPPGDGIIECLYYFGTAYGYECCSVYYVFYT